MAKSVRVRRPPRSSAGAGGKVRVVLEVEAEVTGGYVTPAQFEEWLRTAILDYHRWRVGWVGMAMHCSLKTPTVQAREQGEDS